jgi:hypothetical protein
MCLVVLAELVKVENDWLWRNGKIGSMPEVGFDYFGKLAMEEMNDRMKNIAGGKEPIAWCGWLLVVRIAAEDVWNLALFFF